MSSHKNTPLEILLLDYRVPRGRQFVYEKRVRSLGPRRSDQLQPADDTENWSVNRAQRRKNGVNSHSYMRTIGDRLHLIEDQKRQQQKELKQGSTA